MNVSLLSIDAWREPEGWTWNAWCKRGEVPVNWCDLPPRRLLQLLRNYVNIPRGRIAIEDDGYNLVIVLRGTREPLYAIGYGEAA